MFDCNTPACYHMVETVVQSPAIGLIAGALVIAFGLWLFASMLKPSLLTISTEIKNVVLEVAGMRGEVKELRGDVGGLSTAVSGVKESQFSMASQLERLREEFDAFVKSGDLPKR